ncbi:MAG TPA: class I SAM-dependent methyltransferase [Methanocella sp.]|nr:class I SAM-dependent methyltransferase [Methanocella sp.]
MSSSAGKLHGNWAVQYDELCTSMGCHAPEVLFGLAFEYVRPGQRLLDLGIGTGLSASLFRRAGLEVFGIDFSAEMLEICGRKGIATGLKFGDIDGDWPYPDSQFHHVSSCGVFHFIGDLRPVFGEARRVLKPGGTFSFTTKEIENGKANHVDPVSGIKIYCHRQADIETLTNRHQFKLLKRLTFYMYDDPAKVKRSLFTAHVLNG